MKRGGIYSVVCFLVLIISLTSICFAEESIFFNGNIGFRLDENYSAGDTINSVITAFNQEDFPIAEASLVIELVKGCSEPIYPSQISDCDNIIDEIIISDLNLAQKTSKQIPFSYPLPFNLQTGTYRFDVYLVARKAPIVGIPSILLPGMYKSFYIHGIENIQEVKILRTKTNIKSQTGPIGIGVEKNEKINLQVYINSSSEESAELYVGVCDWEDTTCKEYLIEKTLPLNLKTGEQKIDVEFNAPTSTSAYPIRLEIRKNGKILSLYRSRIVVFGESAKIRKIYPDKIVYGREEAKINVLVGPSPDHYNSPTIRNVKLTVKLTNLDGEVYEKSETINEIAPNNFLKKEFSFSVKELRDYEICGKIESSMGEVYDSECYRVILSKFSSLIHLIELEKSYEEDNFKGKLCVKDALTNLLVDTKVSILVTENNSVVVMERREISGCSDLTFKIKENVVYELKVYDKTTSQEFRFEIAKEAEKETGIGKIIELGKNYWFLGIILLIIIVVVIILIIRKRGKANEL